MELELSTLGSIGPKNHDPRAWRARMAWWAIATLPALLLLVGCRDSSIQIADEEIQVFELTIENRQVAVSGDAIRVRQGQPVRIRWLTDEAISIHLHGYDIEASLVPDKPVVWNFEANATGRFPIEAHGFGESEQPAQTHDHSNGLDHASHDSTPDIRPADGTLLYFEVHPR